MSRNREKFEKIKTHIDALNSYTDFGFKLKW